jgi:hypothetical protein
MLSRGALIFILGIYAASAVAERGTPSTESEAQHPVFEEFDADRGISCSWVIKTSYEATALTRTDEQGGFSGREQSEITAKMISGYDNPDFTASTTYVDGRTKTLIESLASSDGAVSATLKQRRGRAVSITGNSARVDQAFAKLNSNLGLSRQQAGDPLVKGLPKKTAASFKALLKFSNDDSVGHQYSYVLRGTNLRPNTTGAAAEQSVATSPKLVCVRNGSTLTVRAKKNWYLSEPVLEFAPTGRSC